MDKTKIWILAGAIVMIATLAMGWFVGAQPQLAAIADTDEQTRSIEAQNQATQIALTKLKGDYENIDEFRAELEKLRQSIPADAAMPTFLTQLDTLASQTGAKITGIAVDGAVPYTAPASSAEKPPAPAESPEEATGPEAASEDSDTADESGEAEDPAPVILTDPRITPENFVAVPISIDVQGTNTQILDFTSSLQHGTRLYLVTQMSVPLNTEDPTQFDLHIEGYAYVLLAP